MTLDSTENARWPELQRARRAIVVVDVVESVRLMQQHEDEVIDRWRRFVHEVRTELLPRHGGRMVKSLGDGMLLVFERPSKAVAAAIDMDHRIAELNAGCAASATMVLRFGIHAGDIVIDELDVYGPAVNLTARLAALADSGGTVVTAEVRDELLPGIDAEIEDLGEHDLRGITEPVRVFRVGPPPSRRPVTVPETLRSQTSIMVLPFNPHDLPEARIASLLLADNLIHALSRTSHWRVMSRLSSHALADRSTAAIDVARDLGVAYIVSGHCSLVGDRLVVGYEIADVESGTVLTAGRVVEALDALLAQDDPVTAHLLEAIASSIFSAELRRASSRPLPLLRSYSLLFGGMALMHRMSRVDFARAHELLDQLCRRHPHAPEPRVWLAKWHVLNIVQGWSSELERSAQEGHEQVLRALQEDPENALALAMEGLIDVLLRDDLASAERHYDASVAANQNEAYAHLFRSALYAYTDRGPQAVEEAQLAMSLSPLDPNRYFFESFLAHAHLAAGHHQEAVAAAVSSLKSNASHLPTWRTLAIAQGLDGQVDAARTAVQRLRALQPNYTLESFRRRNPGRDGRRAADYMRALEAAGLPD